MLNSEIIFFKTSAQPIMISRLVLAPIFFILLGFTHGQIADVCNVTNVGDFNFRGNDIFVCERTGLFPLTYEFVPVCSSDLYSCVDCDLSCQNGGVCVNSFFSFFDQCLCQENWGGDTCEISVSGCEKDSVCVLENVVTVTCKQSSPSQRGYFVQRCQMPGVNCNPSSCETTCRNGGRCITRESTFFFLSSTVEECLCTPGYFGSTCSFSDSTTSNVSSLCSTIDISFGTSAGYKATATSALLAAAILCLYLTSLI